MSTSNDKIIRVINETKRSTVYLVKRNDIEVVRKDLKVSNVNIDQINQEMEMMKNLRDRSVVIYKESFYDQKSGLYHIYMEYFEEGDLYTRICQHDEENKDFKEEEVVNFCKCMCNSLKYIHSSCVIHRNMKPQNIYIDDSNIYVLGDFGICMMSDLRESKLIGTENYMAPELWDKDYPIYTPATDIFAFGCILYEVYTLRRLYPGRDINEIRNRIFDNKLPSFQRHDQPRIPQIEVLITKMLEKNPLSRINLESVDKQFNPWVNVMNSSTILLPVSTRKHDNDNNNNNNDEEEEKEDDDEEENIQQNRTQSSTSDDSVECNVFQISRNKSMLSRSLINRSSGQINDFDDDEEDESPVSSLLMRSSNNSRNNDNNDNDNYTFVKRSRRVGPLFLSLGSLSGEKIVQFYLNERDLNGKLICDYLKMTEKEIDDFDFLEYLPFYFPLLNQEVPKFEEKDKQKFNEDDMIKVNYYEMIHLVLRKYGEVNSNCSHFSAKDNWKDSREIEDVLIHIISSIKSIYGENQDDNYYRIMNEFFNENHVSFICGVNDNEKVFNELNEEIDPYTGEKKNSLTIIDFYTNVIPVGGYKISDICELKVSIINQFPLQHFIPWLFPELYQQNPRFDPFDKSSMKYIKDQWINNCYCIINKILKENNINFDYNHKQIQVIGSYVMSDELKLYIVKMAEFLRMMGEDENATAFEEFLCENGSNGRVVGLVKPIRPSQINQPPPLPPRKNSPPQAQNPVLPPLAINSFLPRSPQPPPHQHQQNNNQNNNNRKPLFPQIPQFPQVPQVPPSSQSSYPIGPPQPRGFNPPPPLPPRQLPYSEVVGFYLGEVRLNELNIDYFINSPLEILVDFDFINHINYFTPVIDQKYPLFTANDAVIMRKNDIKKKYEVICTKIMERYNFVVFENERYTLMNQKIENKELKDMLYQMRQSIKEIYHDENLIKNIEFCLGLQGKSKKKESPCIIF